MEKNEVNNEDIKEKQEWMKKAKEKEKEIKGNNKKINS